MQYHERPTRSNVGSSSTPGDGPRSGARTGGASEAAGGVGPKAPAEAPTTSAIDIERNASVLRIAVHLKGARMLVAVASRLDTPTTAAAAAAEAAQSKREAQAWRETSSAAATACEEKNAAGEDGLDDFLDEDEVQSPDAEVLPRDWKVTNNAPVYLRNLAAAPVPGLGVGVARESSGGGSSGNSPFLRRGGMSIYGSSTASPGPNSGTPYVNHDSRGGGERSSGSGRGFSYRDDRRWRQRSGGGGDGDTSRHDEDAGGHRHRRGMSGDSSAGMDGAANATEDHNGSWFERGGQGQLRWREITQQPFDLMLLVDTGKELGCPRVLLTMPEYGVEDQEKERRKGRSPGGLYICPTMAEYCLLLSVYFGEETRQGRVGFE